MLKFIGRFLVILALSIMLAFGIYWIVQRNPSALGLRNFPGGFEQRRFNNPNPQGLNTGANASQTGIQPGFEGRGFGDGGRDFNGRSAPGFGVIGILRNLGVIGLITLAVAGLQKMRAFAFRKHSVKAVS